MTPGSTPRCSWRRWRRTPSPRRLGESSWSPRPGAVNKPFQKVSDGIDTLRGIERLQFTNADGTTQTLNLAPPSAAPTAVTAVQAGGGTARVSFTPATVAADFPTTSFVVQAFTGTTAVGGAVSVPATATSALVTGLTNGTTYTFKVSAVNLFGTGPASAASNALLITNLPSAPTNVVGTRGSTTVALSWTAPASNGGFAITGYTIQVRSGATLVQTITTTGAATTRTVTGLVNGTAYTFTVAARNVNGTGPFSAPSAAVTPASAPTVAPATPVAVTGAVGAPVTASVNFTPIAASGNGGSPVTAYRVAIFRVVLGVPVPVANQDVAATATTATFTGLVNGANYRFTVRAVNDVGAGPLSALSNTVAAR